MAWTPQEIQNLTLQELNHETIADWNDSLNTDIPIIKDQYKLAVPVALSRYEWSWAQKFALITLSPVPSGTIIPGRFQKVGNLPSDALCNIVGYRDEFMRMLGDYIVIGSKIYSNVDKLYLKYTYNPGESAFPAEFVDWFKVFFATRLNGYLNGDMQRQQLLESNEPVLFRTAKNIDTKRNKHPSLDSNPMLWARARFGGGYIG